MESINGTSRGCFITLEGIDGCGKSTQAVWLASQLEAAGVELVVLREPGGTKISEQIRSLLLDPKNSEMCDECELLLYEASRAQLVREVIEPALARGAVVLCDRFFDSTYAYQAGGRGLDASMVIRANDLGSCQLVPDRTIVFDIEPSVAFGRATQGGADRLEAAGLAFQERVRDAYLALAKQDADRVRVIDASGSVAEVAEKLWVSVADLLPEGCIPSERA